MIIADTSIWIEYLRGNAEGEALPLFIKRNDLIAISAVFGELFQGAKSKREVRILTSFWENLPKIDESDLFVDAGKLSSSYNLKNQGVGLIDCYLLAAASKYDCSIWTQDKKLSAAIKHINSE